MDGSAADLAKRHYDDKGPPAHRFRGWSIPLLPSAICGRLQHVQDDGPAILVRTGAQLLSPNGRRFRSAGLSSISLNTRCVLDKQPAQIALPGPWNSKDA